VLDFDRGAVSIPVAHGVPGAIGVAHVAESISKKIVAESSFPALAWNFSLARELASDPDLSLFPHWDQARSGYAGKGHRVIA